MDKKKKYRVVILVAALFVCGVLYLVWGPGTAGDSGADVFVAGNPSTGDAAAHAAEAGISETGDNGGDVYVYICGAVKHPGVYVFSHNPRIVEAVEKAGGFTKKADQASVNLASLLEDGAQVVISEKSKKGSKTGTGQTDDSSGTGSDDRIDINTAGREDLKKIPGIGDAKADAIVSYREEHGRFAKTEDLMQISGIKQGIFDRIKDYIKV